MPDKFTKEQIVNYKLFEQVRASGRYNMYHPNARIASGLTEDEYDFVKDNFVELREQAEQEENKDETNN